MTPTGTDEPGPLRLATMTLSGLGIGLAAGAAAAAFVAVLHGVIHLIWYDLPHQFGLAQPPWWQVLGLPLVGAALTYLFSRGPGHGGHSPLHPVALGVTPRELTSVLLATLASLCFGAVLGPEAPLLAIGSAIGIALSRPHPATRQTAIVVGAMAAAGAVLGNPLVTAILLLELVAALGAQAARPQVLIPTLAGLGGGYLLQVGVGQWTGLGETRLSVPGLPAYPNVRLVDLALALLVAAASGLAALLAQRIGRLVAGLAGRAPLATLLASALVVGSAALAVQATTGEHADRVLFAGQSTMAAYLTLPTIGVAVIVLLGKFVAYAASLGGGFKGGVMFPAVAMAAILARVGSLQLGPDSLPALAAAGIAAAVACATGFTFTSVLLATLLTIASGPAVTVPAIMGAIVGALLRAALPGPKPDGA